MIKSIYAPHAERNLVPKWMPTRRQTWRQKFYFILKNLDMWQLLELYRWCFQYLYVNEWVYSLMLTDFSGSVPSTPLGFEVQPNPQVPAQFEITSVDASQPLSPEDSISAFIFRVQHAEDTFYVLQVFSIRKIVSCLPTFTRDYSIVSKHRK